MRFSSIGGRRYDLIGKRIFGIGEKYYFENLGIDFIDETDNKRIYLQVVLRRDDESTTQREFGNLLFALRRVFISVKEEDY